MKLKKQKGLGLIGIIIVIAVLAIAGGGGLYYRNRQLTTDNQQQTVDTKTTSGVKQTMQTQVRIASGKDRTASTLQAGKPILILNTDFSCIIRLIGRLKIQVVMLMKTARFLFMRMAPFVMT